MALFTRGLRSYRSAVFQRIDRMFVPSLALPLRVWGLFNLTPFDPRNGKSLKSSPRLAYTIALIAFNVLLLVFYAIELRVYVGRATFLFFLVLEITIFNFSRLHVIVSLTESWRKRESQMRLIELMEQIDFVLTYKCGIDMNHDAIRKRKGRHFAVFFVALVGFVLLLTCAAIFLSEPHGMHFWINCLVNHLWNSLHLNQYSTFVGQIRLRLAKINERIDCIKANQISMSQLRREVNADVLLLAKGCCGWKANLSRQLTSKNVKGICEAVNQLHEAAFLVGCLFNWTVIVGYALTNFAFIGICYILCLCVSRYTVQALELAALCAIFGEIMHQMLHTMLTCNYTAKEVSVLGNV